MAVRTGEDDERPFDVSKSLVDEGFLKALEMNISARDESNSLSCGNIPSDTASIIHGSSDLIKALDSKVDLLVVDVDFWDCCCCCCCC